MGWALVDMELGKIKFRLNDKQRIFNVYHSIWQPDDLSVVYMIDTIDDDAVTMPIEEGIRVEVLGMVIVNFHSDIIDEYDEKVSALYASGSYNYALKKID